MDNKNRVGMEDHELIEARSRLRELGAGAIQAMIALEMQIDVLRRQIAAGNPVDITAELSRMQGMLRKEVVDLREIARQPLKVDSSNFIQFLQDTVERFQRQTSIAAHFVSELDEVDMPQPVCRELAFIMQQCLVRVRSHTATQNILMRLTATDSHWQLTMEDDGRQGDYTRKGGLIRERLRLIEGELTAEPKPGGRGTRLVVTVPKPR